MSRRGGYILASVHLSRSGCLQVGSSLVGQQRPLAVSETDAAVFRTIKHSGACRLLWEDNCPKSCVQGSSRGEHGVSGVALDEHPSRRHGLEWVAAWGWGWVGCWAGS